MKAYIISYFGNTEDANIRRANHRLQIEWWREHSPGIEFVILSQCYKPNDYIQADYITYINSPKVAPAAARNILLKQFYSSNEEWSMWMDDDAILNYHPAYPHTHLDLNHVLETYPNNFDVNGQQITYITPHNANWPGDGGINKKYTNIEKNTHDYRHVDWNTELLFTRLTANAKGTLFWLRNITQKILQDSEFFVFDEQGLMPMEDIDFMLQIQKQTRGAYCCRNVILKEYLQPSTWAPVKSERNNRKAEVREYFIEKYDLPTDYIHMARSWPFPYGPKQFTTPYLKHRDQSVFEKLFL